MVRGRTVLKTAAHSLRKHLTAPKIEFFPPHLFLQMFCEKECLVLPGFSHKPTGPEWRS